MTIDHALHDTLEELLRTHGPMTRADLAARARFSGSDTRIDLEAVESVLDYATLLVLRPDGRVSHLRDVLDGIVLTHRLRGTTRDRTDLWLGAGVQPFLTMALLHPLPLAGGGEAAVGDSPQSTLVGPTGWLPEAERGDLLSLTWHEGALSVTPVGPEDLAGPAEQEHVRRMVAEHCHAELWLEGRDPDERAGRIVRALALARLEDPELLTTPHPPLDVVCYDPLEVHADTLFRDDAANRQCESVTYCIDRMPVALDRELRARATQYGMTVDQFVIALLGHLAWRTPFAEDVEPWDQWLPSHIKGAGGTLSVLPGRHDAPHAG